MEQWNSIHWNIRETGPILFLGLGRLNMGDFYILIIELFGHLLHLSETHDYYSLTDDFYLTFIA